MEKTQQPQCSLCHRDIPKWAEYWYCNGATVCQDCFPQYAKGEFGPYRCVAEGRQEP